MKFYILSIFLLGFVQLENVEWRLVSFYNPSSPESKPDKGFLYSICLNDNRANGHIGCNVFMGNFKVEKDTIKLQNVAVSEALCGGNGIKFGNELLGFLYKVQYKIKGDTLILTKKGTIAKYLKMNANCP